MQTLYSINFSNNPLIRSFLKVAQRIDRIKQLSKELYYDVLLSKYRCPNCNKRLEIISPSVWSCNCGLALDPTISFQISSCCRASLKRRTFHYACSICGKSVSSRFMFDEKVFDRAYFRERMFLSRQKKQQKREEMRRLLAANRSGRLQLSKLVNLEEIAGLTVALNDFVNDDGIKSVYGPIVSSPFSLDMYRRHILSQLTWNPVLFSALTVLGSNDRVDRIHLFVTLVFMQQSREVELTQSEDDLWVQKVHHEAYC